MEQGDGEQPPTDNQHRVSHLRGAAVDDQVDDEQKAENGRDDQRSGNDLAPLLVCVGGSRFMEEVLDGH